ncbi:MAG: hypothetical protein IKX54_01750 [Lachnospiraceae bacterium]|nr:hypothetical protein [Lachnospiraceae bacterium]
MKKVLGVALLIVCVGILSGCCLKHDWAEATCTEPKHCTKCGKTEGLSLGHTWNEATCTTPMTCSVCGEKSGEPLGHKWLARTIKAPKTCELCGATEGERLYCDEMEFKKIDSNLLQKGRVYFRKDTIMIMDSAQVLHIFDYNENEINTVDFKQFIGEECSWGYNFVPPYIKNDYFITLTVVDPDLNCTVRIFNGYGDQLACLTQPVDIPVGHSVMFHTLADNRYLRFYDDALDGVPDPVLCVDMETMSLVPPKTGTPTEKIPRNKYLSYSSMCYCDKYIYAVTNEGEVVFLEEEYKYTVAQYKEASFFGPDGYALVSEDGKTFDIVDMDFNVHAKGVVEGTIASWAGNSVFLVIRDGARHYYIVK